jgi:hypothetical protein
MLMKTKNRWFCILRFKLYAVLCVVLLGQGLFATPALALNNYPMDRNQYFSAISRGANKLDIFIVRRGEIWMKSWTGSLWTNWVSHGKAPTGEDFRTVTAVAAGNNRWDIFATPNVPVGSANDLVWHLAFDGYYLWGWESIGSIGNASPYGVQAVSTGNGRIDLFSRDTATDAGTASLLWKVWTSSGGWSPSQAGWSNALDGTGSGMTVTALAHSGNRIDLFRRLDSNQSIGRKVYNGTSWGPLNPFTHQSYNMWQDMSGGLATATPYAVSWGTNRIDVFVRGSDNNVWIDSTGDAGTNWTGWNFLGRGDTSARPTVEAYAVSAVAWSSNRLDLFTEESKQLYYKSWNGTNWWPSQTGGWQNLGTIPAGGFVYGYPPLPVSWGPNRIDLFVYDIASQSLSHKWTNGSGWGPSLTGWEDLGPGPF